MGTEGEIEKLGTPKGMPAAKVVLCELALENKGVTPEQLRDPRILIEKAPPFLMGAEGAAMTYVF